MVVHTLLYRHINAPDTLDFYIQNVKITIFGVIHSKYSSLGVKFRPKNNPSSRRPNINMGVVFKVVWNKLGIENCPDKNWLSTDSTWPVLIRAKITGRKYLWELTQGVARACGSLNILYLGNSRKKELKE